MRAAANEIARFSEILQRRILHQLTYDLLQNRRVGRVTDGDFKRHALRIGIVAAIGEWCQWDGDAVTQVAAEILEDSNLQDLAAPLYGILRAKAAAEDKIGRCS